MNVRMERVEVSKLKESPFNVRVDVIVSPDLWLEFKESMKSTGGPLEPLIVNSNYEVVIGKRRYEACKQVGIKEVNVIVNEELDDGIKAIAASFHENEKRFTLSTNEKLKAISMLVDEGLNNKQIAKLLATSEATISKMKSSISIADTYNLPKKFDTLSTRKKLILRQILDIKKNLTQEQKVELVDKAFELSKEILENILNAVKAGGNIIYPEVSKPDSKVKEEIQSGIVKREKDIAEDEDDLFQEGDIEVESGNNSSLVQENVPSPVQEKVEVTIYFDRTLYEKMVKRSNEVGKSVEDMIHHMCKRQFS